MVPGPAGLLASFDTGVVSNERWLCHALAGPATEPVPAWTSPTFDARTWTAAKVITEG